ncbi:hypothetical protein HYPGJ_20119 [Hyphomicrobium sp. GJ21]|nr:hypothetical protein HYPGJ_20119 [Hyphomicrobium sp. GJ21]
MVGRSFSFQICIQRFVVLRDLWARRMDMNPRISHLIQLETLSVKGSTYKLLKSFICIHCRALYFAKVQP